MCDPWNSFVLCLHQQRQYWDASRFQIDQCSQHLLIIGLCSTLNEWNSPGSSSWYISWRTWHNDCPLLYHSRLGWLRVLLLDKRRCCDMATTIGNLALSLLVGLLFIPESPRWLMMQGRDCPKPLQCYSNCTMTLMIGTVLSLTPNYIKFRDRLQIDQALRSS